MPRSLATPSSLALLATAALLAACADSPQPFEPAAAAAVPVPPRPQLALVASSLSHELFSGPLSVDAPIQEVAAINAHGWMVGSTQGGYDGSFYRSARATLWKDGTAISLGVFDPTKPSRSTWGYDVNDAGVVVGYGIQTNETGSIAVYRAFRWVEGEGFTLLPNLPTTTGRTVAEAINEQGMIVGWTLTSQAMHAIYWTDAGQPPTDLGTLGGQWARAHDVNDAGDIAGTIGGADGHLRAFLRESDGTLHVLPEPGAMAHAVNAHGVVTGIVLTAEGNRAFRWSESDGFAYLGAPDWSNGSVTAHGIDDAGRIVGAAEIGEQWGSYTYRAVLWADGSWVTLDGPPHGSTSAADINAQGQVAGAPIVPELDRTQAIRWSVTLAEETPPFTFTGFFPPVENAPVVNRARAGRAIPVKFSLGGDQGLGILAPGYPQSQPIACDGSIPTSSVEETVTAGGSGLQYDAAADQYVYVWKTDAGWAGGCRRLVVRLVDGTERFADFAFDR